MSPVFSWDLFRKMPVVGIIRHLDPEAVATLLPLYLECGLTTLEITLNTPGASSMIREALDQYGGQLNIGAGTVRTMAGLDEALEAGAQFVVMPGLDEDIVTRCVALGVPVFPGAFTPTEIQRAWNLGASMVKVYPAGRIGPEYIRDLKAPLDDILLLPTGGIDLQNVKEFMQAGADGVGMGSQLFDKTLIKHQNWEGLKAHFRAVGDAVRGESQPVPLPS